MREIQRALAIGSHPDDIEIGCGGTIAKWVKEYGVEFYTMTMTSGESGGSPDVRMKEQEAAGRLLGVHKHFWGDYKDTKLPLSADLISDIEGVINEIKPDVVLVHYNQDTHQDHRSVSTAAITASRYTSNLLFYEGPSTYGFTPVTFVDITDSINQKYGALYAHNSQVSKTNVKNLLITQIAEATAIFRGVECRAKYAEGFMPFRFFL